MSYLNGLSLFFFKKVVMKKKNYHKVLTDRKMIQSFFLNTLGVLPPRMLKFVIMVIWLPW